jgi:transcriptional regulator
VQSRRRASPDAMYIPRQFDVADPAWNHALIRAHSVAIMITADDMGVPFATHLPFLLDDGRAPKGTLRGHVARSNPHWRYLAAGRPTLVVFAGAHAYVSPSWYASGPAVPTWNYVAVHAAGIGVLVADSIREGLPGGPGPWV